MGGGGVRPRTAARLATVRRRIAQRHRAGIDALTPDAPATDDPLVQDALVPDPLVQDALVPDCRPAPDRRLPWRRRMAAPAVAAAATALVLLLGQSSVAASPTGPNPTASAARPAQASPVGPDAPDGTDGAGAQDGAGADPSDAQSSATASAIGTGGTTAPDCTPPAPAAPPSDEPVVPGGRYADHHLSDDQASTAATIIAVGKAMGITDRGVRIALAAAMMESSLHPWQVSGPYVGLFQQLADSASGKYTAYSRSDAVGASRMFYQQLVEVDPGYQTDTHPDWQIAEQIQQTGEGEIFQQWQALATELTDTFYDAVPPYQFYPQPTPALPAACQTASGGGGFDPGNIISDQVFYDAGAMSVDQVRTFIDSQNAACQGEWCLSALRVDTPAEPADAYCDAYAGGPDQDAADVITGVAVACHVNPQVMLVTLQKESGLLTRTDVTAANYAAAWGWHCPDSGPGSSANCDPAYAGFFNQAYGMAKQWARYRVDPGNYHYQAGETADIAWNVAASGCGSAPVHIANTATASLYNYTPYQPNAASLASYPGTGDACSSYGNRNFYFLFTDYFGPTGGGSSVAVHGVSVTIPDSPYVPAELVGATITAPNAAVAQGIAAGLATLGTPYVWGGGTDGGPADQGCARGGGSSNSCQGIVGFDCSGLTRYVLRQAGFDIPGDSTGQRAGGTDVPWSQGLPGDIIGFPGHVAIYLGAIDGTQYLLEAPYPGAFVHVRSVYTMSGSDPTDSVLHRYWH
jgi:cell wall-associated NlpC family hydrolase